MAVTLPPGWTIVGSDELVPNPNNGTGGAMPNDFFGRKTYTCRNQLGGFVCASGALEDCEAQALTAAQSRTQQRPYNGGGV